GKGILLEEPKPLKKKQQIEQDEQYARELHTKLNKNIDWDEVIDHLKLKAKEDPAMKKYQAIKRKKVVDVVKDVEEAKVDESAQDQGRQAESQAKIFKIDMDHANKVLSMQEDETKPAKV
nr:hypothetical protein [Tanacetum cinerariifolium]